QDAPAASSADPAPTPEVGERRVARQPRNQPAERPDADAGPALEHVADRATLLGAQPRTTPTPRRLPVVLLTRPPQSCARAVVASRDFSSGGPPRAAPAPASVPTSRVRSSRRAERAGSAPRGAARRP